MSTQLQGLLKRLDEIVDGIDRDESDGGWWETEKGVELGKTTLRELRQLVTEAAQSTQPAPPADGEVAELTGKLVEAANGAAAMGWDQHAQRILRAAELLQRQALAPVAVSERLPGDQLCWWLEPDEEDEAYGSSWTLLRIRGRTSSYTHWLPAHALPLPEAE